MVTDCKGTLENAVSRPRRVFRAKMLTLGSAGGTELAIPKWTGSARPPIVVRRSTVEQTEMEHAGPMLPPLTPRFRKWLGHSLLAGIEQLFQLLSARLKFTKG